MNYLFAGQAPRFYPGFGNMIACPGDVFELDELPNDGLWFETDQPVNPKPSRMWPIPAFSPTVNQAPAVEVPVPASPTDPVAPEQAPPVPEVTPEVPKPADSQEQVINA